MTLYPGEEFRIMRSPNRLFFTILILTTLNIPNHQTRNWIAVSRRYSARLREPFNLDNLSGSRAVPGIDEKAGVG